MNLIDNRSIQRARRACRCIALNQTFYSDIQEKGLDAETVFLKSNQYQVKGSKWFKSSASLEDSFRWLIIIGFLRREVDGQGLTSKVRLTPLGRQILEEDPNLPDQKAGIVERMKNLFYRNWPLR